MPYLGDDSSSIDLLINRGNGTFVPSAGNRSPGTSPNEITGTGSGPNFLVVGDFNGDGKDDIVEEVGYRIYERTSLGDGSFSPVVPTNLDHYGPINVVLGDFNGDGKLDIAFTTYGPTNIPIFLGNGDGTFQDPAQGYDVNLFNTVPIVQAVGDFNGDGKDDVLATSEYSSDFGIADGNAAGGFDAPSDDRDPFVEPPGVDDGEGDLPYNAVGDFNGDGKLDLVGGSPPTVLYGNGDGTLNDPSAADYPVNGQTEAVKTGDFNGDGKLDLAVLSGPSLMTYGPGNGVSGQAIEIFPGHGDGTLGLPYQIPLEGNPDAFAVGDFNGDGRTDFAVTLDSLDQEYDETGPNTVEIFLANGDGTYKPPIVIPDGQGDRSIAVGDLNGDGKLDLVTIGLNQADPMELIGQGDGTFSAPVSIAASSIPASLTFDFGQRPVYSSSRILDPTPTVVAEGDFQGDGHPFEVTSRIVSFASGFLSDSLQLVATSPPTPLPTPILIASTPGTSFYRASTPTVFIPDAGLGDDVTAVLGHFLVPPSWSGSTPSGYMARIDWGDGVSDGIITPAPNAPKGTYLVVGSHGYASPGTYTVTITLEPLGGGGRAVATTQIVYNILAGQTPNWGQYGRSAGDVLAGQFDVFGDPLPASPGSLSATIDWGDGTTSPATIGPVQNGVDYPISGGHIWAMPGFYWGTIRVSSSVGLLATFHFFCLVNSSDLALNGQFVPSGTSQGDSRFVGTSDPGSTVTLKAYQMTPAGESAVPIVVGSAKVAANGSWAITGPALPPGSYAIVGMDFDVYSTRSGFADLYGGPAQSPLVITPPIVAVKPVMIAVPSIRTPGPAASIVSKVSTAVAKPPPFIVPPRPAQSVVKWAG